MANGDINYGKVHGIAVARNADCTQQTPREVLLDMLGRIDRGEVDPDTLVVSYGYWDKEDDSTRGYGFGAAGMDSLAITGLLHAIILMFNKG